MSGWGVEETALRGALWFVLVDECRVVDFSDLVWSGSTERREQLQELGIEGK